MQQFGWTEQQLYQQNSYKRIIQIGTYNEINNQVQKENERRAKHAK